MNKSKKRASRSMQLRVLTIKNFNFILNEMGSPGYFLSKGTVTMP